MIPGSIEDKIRIFENKEAVLEAYKWGGMAPPNSNWSLEETIKLQETAVRKALDDVLFTAMKLEKENKLSNELSERIASLRIGG